MIIRQHVATVMPKIEPVYIYVDMPKSVGIITVPLALAIQLNRGNLIQSILCENVLMKNYDVLCRVISRDTMNQTPREKLDDTGL